MMNNDALQEISERETEVHEVDVIQHVEDTVTARIPKNNPGGPVSMSAGKNKKKHSHSGG